MTFLKRKAPNSIDKQFFVFSSGFPALQPMVKTQSPCKKTKFTLDHTKRPSSRPALDHTSHSHAIQARAAFSTSSLHKAREKSSSSLFHQLNQDATIKKKNLYSIVFPLLHHILILPIN
jgi:hypothetical protein